MHEELVIVIKNKHNLKTQLPTNSPAKRFLIPEGTMPHIAQQATWIRKACS